MSDDSKYYSKAPSKTEEKKQQRKRRRVKSLFSPFPSKASKYKKESKEDVFTVEEIRAKKTYDKKKVLYLVKWQGQGEGENSWEPSSNILDKSLIRDFEERDKKQNWKWQYYAASVQDGKPSGWLEFDSPNQDVVNAAYAKWLSDPLALSTVIIQVPMSLYQYEIDFSSMTQKNLTRKEHTMRMIRRV